MQRERSTVAMVLDGGVQVAVKSVSSAQEVETILNSAIASEKLFRLISADGAITLINTNKIMLANLQEVPDFNQHGITGNGTEAVRRKPREVIRASDLMNKEDHGTGEAGISSQDGGNQ